MTRQTSIYLDAVRFLAAMVVFIGHVSGQRFVGGLLWQLGPYMDEAVVVFFVLSGFVIAYVIDTRESDLASYGVARAARIYSVALPAILATAVLDTLGQALRPELYTASWGFSGEHYWRGLLGGALFVNRLWFADADVGSMLPYWSLCFEAWYYVIFGIVVFAPPRWRAVGALAVLALVGPSIAAMLPIWLMGVAAYHLVARGAVGERVGTVLCLGAVSAFVAYDAWVRAHGVPDLVPAFLRLPGLANDTIVGLLFAAHLVGFNAVSHRLAPVLDRLGRPIRWAAGATFTIYLFHLPIAQFLTTIVPWPPTAPATRFVMFGGTLALMFAIAEVTERRKEPWRRAFTALLARARAAVPRDARVAPGAEGR